MKRFLSQSLSAVVALGLGGLFVFGLFGAADTTGKKVLAIAGEAKQTLASIHLPAMPSIDFAPLKAMAASIVSQPVDGTLIHGLARTISFSAQEEEDPVNIVSANAGSLDSHPVSAGGYLVRNLTRRVTVVGQDAERARPIASLTKLVTAIVAHDRMNGEQPLVLSDAILAAYGNTSGLRAGEKLSLNDMLHPLLMLSSNEAAETIARTYGRKNFIAAMNEFAQSVGAYHTYFADPTGLSADNISTPQDLAIILDWIYLNEPDVLSITAQKSATVRNHTWVNPTHMLSWSNYIGGKNGYTPEANRTAASLFTLGKYKDVYAVIVLGSAARDSDELKLLAQVVD